MNHIPQLDALRACAALWVVLSHLLLVPGWTVPLLSRGENAVTVFVILSGFVIARLQMARHEPYGRYLFRRAVRLYPAYLLGLVAGWLAMDFYLDLARLPFAGAPPPDLFTRTESYQAAPLAHWAAHLLLLHGAIPNSVLPQSDVMFSGPLWSLSLEWQFYLVAPLLIVPLVVRGGPMRAVLAVLLFAAAHGLGRVVEPVWDSQVPAFLPLRLDCFVIGIVCALYWERLRRLSPAALVAIGVGFVLLGGALGIAKTALAVWALGFLLALVAAPVDRAAQGRVGRLAAWCGDAFAMRPLVWLGERSYSLYVLHMPILLCVVAFVVAPLADRLDEASAMALASCLTLPLSVLAAALSYRFVEAPAIAWARRATSARGGVPVRLRETARAP